MALLHLLAACADEHGVTLEAATVDHGLRAAGATEARFVGNTCQSLGIPHETLHWRGWDRQGNLQAEARAARYRLLAGWAGRHRLDSVALGHTMDDIAETFLMRLAREAGVDGLAAMDAVFARDGARFWRPLLAVERGALRDFLTRHRLGWHDDPSNEDEGFDRVKARAALTVLDGLGIDRATLGAVADHLGAASRALGRCTHDLARRIGGVEAGCVVFDRPGLIAADPEIQRRLLAHALSWVAQSSYPPRRDTLAGLAPAIAAMRPHTLHGCLVTVDGDQVRIAREYNAVKDLRSPLGGLWDGRWHVAGPGAALEVGALGEAVKDCPDWRNAGLPRATLMAAPAIWDGERLVAAPLAGFGDGYSATIDPTAGDFFTSILSH